MKIKVFLYPSPLLLNLCLLRACPYYILNIFVIRLSASSLIYSHLKTTSDVTWKSGNACKGGNNLMAMVSNAKDTQKYRSSCSWGLTGSLALLEHQNFLGLGLQVMYLEVDCKRYSVSVNIIYVKYLNVKKKPQINFEIIVMLGKSMHTGPSVL